MNEEVALLLLKDTFFFEIYQKREKMYAPNSCKIMIRLDDIKMFFTILFDLQILDSKSDFNLPSQFN